MNYADSVDEGIIVCGYKLKDMMYSELREYLPDRLRCFLLRHKGNGKRAGKWCHGTDYADKAYDLMIPFR